MDPTCAGTEFTEEQNAIIAALVDSDTDVIVNACAGSGKSTTAIEAARKLYDKTRHHTLIVTFSAKLKEESRRKTKTMLFIRTESVHSLLWTPDFPVKDNEAALRFLADATLQARWYNKYSFANIKLVVLDESQDLCPAMRRIVDFLCLQLAPHTHVYC